MCCAGYLKAAADLLPAVALIMDSPAEPEAVEQAGAVLELAVITRGDHVSEWTSRLSGKHRTLVPPGPRAMPRGSCTAMLSGGPARVQVHQ